VDMSGSGQLGGRFYANSITSASSLGCRSMSVLDDFVRMRLYRERASEFELLAETEMFPDVRLRYRIIARHYRELAEREERADKGRIAEQIKRAKLQRQQAEAKATLPARNDAQFFLIAAE